jgi:uncharacterized repeat protein (TIGR01451 family)
MRKSTIQQIHFFVLLDAKCSPHFCIIKEEPLQILIHRLMYKYLVAALFLLLSTTGFGQGWERTFGGGGQDAANAVLATPDEGYLMTGIKNGKLSLLKTDGNGKFQWSKDISEAVSGNDILRSADGNFVVAGTALGNNKVYLCKIDQFGNILWSKSYNNTISQRGFGVVELPTGGFAIVGKRGNSSQSTNRSVLVIRTDALGNSQWVVTLGTPKNLNGEASIALADNGDIVVAADFVQSPVDKDIFIARLNNASGQIIWQHNLGLSAPDGNKGDEVVRDIQIVPDGFIIAGSTKTFSPQEEGSIIKISPDGSSIEWIKRFPNSSISSVDRDASGNLSFAGVYSINGLDDLKVWRSNANADIVWENVVGRAGFDAANEVFATADGGAICAGLSSPFVNSTELLPYLVKIDKNGLVLTSYLRGNVFRDLDQDCVRDSNEAEIKNWVVKIEKPNFVRFAVSREDGSFDIAVDTGNYQVKMFTPSEVWESCNIATSVSIPNFYDTIDFDLPIRAKSDCPRNEVSIATPILRRCTDNNFTVRYCNSGSIPSPNTYIDVEFGPLLSVTGSSINGTQINATTWRYNVGTLANGDCGSFTVSAFLDCAGSVLGQAQCVQAHIYPDSFCAIPAGWSGAIVSASGACVDDTVKMVLKNVGTTKTQALDFIIAVDVVMLIVPNDPNFSFELEPGQVDTVWTRRADGQTYRIIADQEPGYPGGGAATAAVEGCVTDTTSTPISYGFYTMFPEDDANPSISYDCQEIFESDYNPIYLKRGHPKGYGVSQYISPETDLDYLIQFRNTGSSTIQQVTIRDTLPAGLDPASIRPGSASHPYQFDIFGENVLEFKMSNLNLPPGGANEGFVRFKVAQKPNLTCGTTIENKANITFDFNAPFTTAATFHTVCDPDSFWIISKTKEIFWKGADVKIFPNPLHEAATFEVTGVEAQDYAFYLYDIQGRMVFNQVFPSSNFQLLRGQLPAGQYIYRIAADGASVSTGKLLIH